MTDTKLLDFFAFDHYQPLLCAGGEEQENRPSIRNIIFPADGGHRFGKIPDAYIGFNYPQGLHVRTGIGYCAKDPEPSPREGKELI